ncbi:hypothetical protein UFOVP116_403 [uncultured Caudovirales phage]|uniref:Uncharacterized protein n=1 Tax=uncultured Caudovirales phage TaxID=2100421 RepID=A0A6J5LAK2_9CAUD|nr:hypothetical protein UFOVP116_403 [uncultured Caudovirales phage]
MLDVHIAHMQWDRADWWAECELSLRNQPIVVHNIDGIVGDLRQTRFNGYNCGHYDYVAHVDPDDRVCPGAFAEIIGYLKKHPKCPGVYTMSNRINARGERIGLMHPYRPWDHNYLLKNITEVHQITVMRRDIITGLMQKNWDSLPTMGYTELVYYAMFALKHDWTALDLIGYEWRNHKRGVHCNLTQEIQGGSMQQLIQLSEQLLLSRK